MKSMTMLIASLLLASGCATIGAGGEDDYAGAEDAGYPQLVADSSLGE
jgi:hypothetical protein